MFLLETSSAFKVSPDIGASKACRDTKNREGPRKKSQRERNGRGNQKGTGYLVTPAQEEGAEPTRVSPPTLTLRACVTHRSRTRQ